AGQCTQEALRRFAVIPVSPPLVCLLSLLTSPVAETSGIDPCVINIRYRIPTSADDEESTGNPAFDYSKRSRLWRDGALSAEPVVQPRPGLLLHVGGGCELQPLYRRR